MKEIERIILGRCLTQQDEVTKVFTTLTPSDFRCFPTHAKLLEEAWKENVLFATKLSANGFRVDDFYIDDYRTKIETLALSLKRGNAAADIISTLGTYQKQIDPKNLEEQVSQIQAKLLSAITHTAKEDYDISLVIEELEEQQRIYQEKKVKGNELLGLSTGNKKLDLVIDRLREGHLWILGGYTNLGKTFAALNIVAHLIKNGHRTAFYSLEMSKVDILCRILGILTKQNGVSIAKGYGEKKKTSEALEVVRKSQFAVFKDKHDISEISLSIYEECVRNKPAVIVIDFLQLVQCKAARSEYEATTTAILELQKIAQRLKVPIIVLSQVSNESAKNGDQQVMGFKGSGGIAAAADLAIELVSGEENVKALREKMDKGEPVKINWHVKKNRHGRVGTIPMELIGKYGIFKDAMDF